MFIRGSWTICADGVARPIIAAAVLSANGTWKDVPLLLDTGADRTVFSRVALDYICGDASQPSIELGGIGGFAAATLIETTIRLQRDDGNEVSFRGEFAAFTQREALDMSVLGRDILNLFAVIVDKPGDAVCLMGQRHGYRIEIAG